jgi:hypothetical protein
MKVGPGTFQLRLPESARQRAMQLAQFEGLSLNQFIALAVTEKIVRMGIFNPYVEDSTSKLSKSRIPRH